MPTTSTNTLNDEDGDMTLMLLLLEFAQRVRVGRIARGNRECVEEALAGAGAVEQSSSKGEGQSHMDIVLHQNQQPAL